MFRRLISKLPVREDNHLAGIARCLLSTPSTATTAAPDFSNHRLIYEEQTTKELLRALFVLQTCSIQPLVNNSQTLLKVGHRLLGERLLSAIVHPFYWQFVAGDSTESLGTVCEKLNSRGVTLMLAPTLESDVTDSDNDLLFHRNLERMVWFLQLTALHGRTKSSTTPPLCQAKVTGHCSPVVLEKISLIYSDMNIDEREAAVHWLIDIMDTTKCSKDWNKLDLSEFMELNRYDESSATVTEGPFGLTDDEHKAFVEAMRRMALYGIMSEQYNILMTVDAEFTYTNPAINLVTMALMKRHNMNSPVVWGTYQAYLKNTKQWLSEDTELAERLKLCFSFKVVRGAYMEHERKTALRRGNQDPVHGCYEDTNLNYNDIIKKEMKRVYEDPTRRGLLIASHNEESVRLASNAMSDSLPHSLRHHCSFGQIYGMAENISIPLAASGAVVYKSVPVGSVGEVLPYLARRANENRAVLKGARRERELLFREIRRRVRGQ